MVSLLEKNGDKWFFPPLAGGIEQGLSQGGIDLFKSTDNLGRESAQNCRNAAIDDSKVVVKYNLKNIDSSFFPARDDYLARLESAKSFFEEVQGLTGDEVKRIQDYIKILNKKTIPTLVISDFNTSGLDGLEEEKSSRYYRFIKSTGISAEQGTTAGTYGHGKNALMTFSQLRAITAFSQFKSANNDESFNKLFIGMANLCTHRDLETNNKTQSTGFYCIKSEDSSDWSAYRNDDVDNIKLPIQREENGTDIYVWGFDKDREGWDIKLAMGLIYAFFQAILEDKIEFQICNEDNLLYTINKQSIDDILLKLESDCKKVLSDSEWRKNMYKVEGYIKCFNQEDKFVKKKTKRIFGLGLVELSIYSNKNDQSLSNRYCLMRLPLMTIQDFGYKRSGTPYAAVCKLLELNGNKVIADLEDPTHTKLSPDYVRSVGSKKHHALLLTSLKRWIREEIDLIDPKIESFEEIPGLSEYLSGGPLQTKDESFFTGDQDPQDNEDEETFGKKLKKGTQSSNPSSTYVKRKSLTIKKKPSSRGSKGGGRGTHGGKGKANGGKGYGSGNDKGGADLNKDGDKKTIIPSENVQIIRTRKDNNNKISVFRVKALTAIEGTLRLGYALNSDGGSFVSPKGAKLISCSIENIKCENLIFENLKLKQGCYLDFELELDSYSNIAIGAY